MGTQVSIPTLASGEAMPGYRADPSASPRGAIVVIQEIFGVNPGIRAKCDHWASRGYVAVAPELFWRFAPGVELDPDKPEELREAFDLMEQLDHDGAVRDLEAAIRYARGASGNGKVGVVGYCLGGRLAYLVASRTDADASVGYYPVGLDDLLGEQHAIGKPLMLHIAEEDHFVPKAQQETVREGLAGNRHVVLHSYAGVDHGFAAEHGARRAPDAAALADSRTDAFFAEHVR